MFVLIRSGCSSGAALLTVLYVLHSDPFQSDVFRVRWGIIRRHLCQYRVDSRFSEKYLEELR